MTSSRLELNLDKTDEEYARSLTVGEINENQYILVSTVPRTKSPRILVAKAIGNRLIKIATIYEDRPDSPTDPRGYISAHEFVGCYGRLIVWVALEFKLGIAKFFAFDIIREELQELKSKRIEHLVRNPDLIHRFGDYFYYVGRYGRFMKMSVNYENK